MAENQMIKGEYFFDINIYSMFGVYNICTKNTNIITSGGMNFFLNRWVTPPTIEDGELSDTLGYLGHIATGNSIVQPSMSDYMLIEQNNIFFDTEAEVKDNQIILTVETSGDKVGGTTEIGVYTTSTVLVSRDVHERYVLPSSSTVKITYIYTLSQIDKSEIEEEEEYDD